MLSGWLLGCLLFKEMAQGGINVRRFWVRRWMRTLPAYYVVLIYTIAQQVLTKDDPSTPWTYFFFLQNYDYPLEIFFSELVSCCRGAVLPVHRAASRIYNLSKTQFSIRHLGASIRFTLNLQIF
ncbi:MAG: hypothetical protein MH219_16525 [Marinobacter sp.]|nr:hypothetical protein [Marinobacter sp.]